MSKDWTNRLITGLFTAAAAWGSVTVEIRKTVNARAELTEQRMSEQLTEHMDAAVRIIDKRSRDAMDTLSMRIMRGSHRPVQAGPITVQSPVDTTAEQRQDEIMVKFERLDQRMRALARALVRLQPATTPQPKAPIYGPGYRDNE